MSKQLNKAQEFERLFARAQKAGAKAERAVKKATVWCGSAWVNVRPGNSAFAKWLRKTGNATVGFRPRGGVDIHVGYSFRLSKAEAGARAMAEVLSDAGITAYPLSLTD